MEPSLIRLMGRWSSDVYELYCRMTRRASGRLGVMIGSTPFQDLEAGGFLSEELEQLPPGSQFALNGDSSDSSEEEA